MDIATIKKLIKEEMIDGLRYGDSSIICCENVIDEFPSEVIEEDKIADTVFEEWHKYVDKIEEFLKTLD